jgi:hypothetical protein
MEDIRLKSQESEALVKLLNSGLLETVYDVNYPDHGYFIQYHNCRFCPGSWSFAHYYTYNKHNVVRTEAKVPENHYPDCSVSILKNATGKK